MKYLAPISRVHGQSLTCTATGRISMMEPNLQNVAKDFEIDFGKEKIMISCRSAFHPNNARRCLISADFCQLEMRILAHLSQVNLKALEFYQSIKPLSICFRIPHCCK